MFPTKENKNDTKSHRNGHSSNQNNGHHNLNGHHSNNKSRTECKISQNNNIQRKIKKFVRCSKKIHLNLRTTTSIDGSLQIIIIQGGLPSDELLYIKQHTQYQVRYNDHDKQRILLATIPQHFSLQFNFKSIASFTQFIINNQFIRFRNRGPTQTKHVSLWRIYKFEGEQTLFNAWIIIQAAEKALGLKPLKNNYKNIKKHKKKKHKNYHLAAYQSNLNRNDSLDENILKRIFSFLQGSKFHVWIHIHEIIDTTHHRSNLIGLEFDSNTRNVYIMQRSPSLLKKVRQIGDKFYTKKNGFNSVLIPAFFKKSVEMFKAVY